MTPNIQILRAALLLLSASYTCALDNPDAPDYLSQLQTEAAPLEAAVREQVSGKEAAEARSAYAHFLDKQLNEAYRKLMKALPDAQRAKLQQSQQEWLRYREAESRFIDANWTPEQFGSSSSISRFDYRAAITRDRIEQLLGYLTNY